MKISNIIFNSEAKIVFWFSDYNQRLYINGTLKGSYDHIMKLMNHELISVSPIDNGLIITGVEDGTYAIMKLFGELTFSFRPVITNITFGKGMGSELEDLCYVHVGNKNLLLIAEADDGVSWFESTKELKDAIGSRLINVKESGTNPYLITLKTDTGDYFIKMRNSTGEDKGFLESFET